MLRKTVPREIRTSLSRYLAIFAIVALGVGFFSGLKDCKASMIKTASAYLEECELYDYRLLSSYGIDDASIETAKETEGVADAEGSIGVDVLASSGSGDVLALKAISLPDRINRLRVTSGRLPEKADECVVDAYSLSSDAYRIGDSIILSDENDSDRLSEFKYKEFTIVGTVNTPIYLDYQRGSTDIGNGSLSSFFYIPRESFDIDCYTELYLTLEGSGEPFSDELTERLKSEQDKMDEVAENITAKRRAAEKKKAQRKLDKRIKEYKDKEADYESEKAKAEAELADAERKIKDGYSTIASNRKKAKDTIADLKGKLKKAESGLKTADEAVEKAASGKSEIEAGLKTAKSERTKLKKAHAAGTVSDEEYAAGIAAADETIKKLEAGLKTARSGLAKAEAARSGIETGIAQAKTGIKTAETALVTLDSEEAKLDTASRELTGKRADAAAEFADARAKLDDAKEKLDRAQEKIDEMETGNSYAFSRDENSGYSSFDSNSSIVDNIAKVFPVFFFLIAALVCMTTMTRMIDEQRTQIGVLRALGYSNAAIAAKYLIYSGSAAFLGAAVGFFAGCRIFPAVIWNAYTIMYGFSDSCEYVIDPLLGLVSLAAALLCSMGATWYAMAANFRSQPSELIRPKAPPAGKRILLERIGPLWRRISFLYKVSIRNIFRDRKRFLMMVIGVSGCTALLIAGLGIRATISKVAEHQFDEISLYDYMTVFSRDMNDKRQSDFADHMEASGLSRDEMIFVHQAEVTVLRKDGNFDVTCTAAEPEGFERYISLHAGDDKIAFPGDGEVVIARKLNRQYGIEVGDSIRLRDGYREAAFRVSAVTDNYVYDNIYMSEKTYREGFGKKPSIKTALVRLSDSAKTDTGTDTDAEADSGADGDRADRIRSSATEAASYKDAAAVSVNLDVRDNVAKTMKSLDAVVYVVILSAALLAFIVLYNLTNINITERIREIATIKVLGFYRSEVAQYVFRENMFLTAIAAVAGIPLGRWLLGFVIDNIVVKMVYFETRITAADYALAVVLTFVFAALVNLAMQRRLRAVSMTESLKSVE